jgi:hypothetical protein
MKEYGNHKTKAQADEEKWRDYQIDKQGDYICSVCKKIWFPTMEKDVNQKRPSVFCKLCTDCRLKSFLKGREYKKKVETNNYDALYDPNNQRDANSVRHERFELVQKAVLAIV